jgi:polar amino acid transport system substrate-binding protein
MNKIIIIGVVVLVALVIGIFVGFNLNKDSEITGKVIEEETQGIRPFRLVMNEWEPHAYSDENGVAQGISIEIVERIFSKLNVSYEINFVPWPRVIKGVETGNYDASLMTSYSLERSEFLYYPEEAKDYIEGPFPPAFVTVSDTVFFVRKQGGDLEVKFNELEEMVKSGYKVGVISGFYSATKIYETGIDSRNVIEYFDTESGFRGLDEGVIDIYVQEKSVGFTVLKKMGLSDTITVLPQSLYTNPQYVAFSKRSDYPNLLEFRKKFLDELRKIHESGEYDEIYNSYIK